MQELNYNAMENFNMVYNQNLNSISGAQPLEGGVQMNIPSEIPPARIDADQELQRDLSALNYTQDDGIGSVASKFSNALTKSMNDLNGLQRGAEEAVETFATGGDIDVHSVMIATQKAQLSLSLAMQLRNKAVQAYTEISKMNI